MLQKLVEFALTQRLLVLIATLLLIGAGGYRLPRTCRSTPFPTFRRPRSRSS